MAEMCLNFDFGVHDSTELEPEMQNVFRQDIRDVLGEMRYALA